MFWNPEAELKDNIMFAAARENVGLWCKNRKLWESVGGINSSSFLKKREDDVTDDGQAEQDLKLYQFKHLKGSLKVRRLYEALWI